MANQEVEQKQRSDQEVRSFKQASINMLPRDFQTVLLALATLACLYEFLQTKDVVWLLTAYALANGSASLPIGKSLIPNQKEKAPEENDVSSLK